MRVHRKPATPGFRSSVPPVLEIDRAYLTGNPGRARPNAARAETERPSLGRGPAAQPAHAREERTT